MLISNKLHSFRNFIQQIYGNSVRFVRAKTFSYGQTVRFSNLSGLKRFFADNLYI